jgi:perosamine synthetase
MLDEFLMQMRPYFGDMERKALSQYDFENNFVTEFKETEKFEKRLAQILKIKSATAVNNGTIALSIAALSVGIKPNDEVLIPNFTMIATPNALKMIGAVPIFTDIELDTWCIDKSEIEKKLSPKTKAVVLVSANGRYPTYNVDELREFLNSKGVKLIEDAAQGLGSTYPDGSAIGTKGNVATLSFSAPKIISTGQGGLVFSRDSKIIEKARKIKDFGRDGGGVDVHPTFGINSKFTDLQAIIGCCQLDQLSYRIKRRKIQHKLYERLLKNINEITFPKNDYVNTAPWFSEIITQDREELAVFLKENNIGTRSVYPEINRQGVYNTSEIHSNSNYISSSGLWLPSHMGVTDDHIHFICSKIKNYFG